MAVAACSDAEFAPLFERMGARALAKHLGITERAIYKRRRNLERAATPSIVAPSNKPSDVPGRVHAEIENGVIVVGSDAHYWPGEPSTAHKALVKFCKEFRPQVVVMNGDVLDGSTISRHAPIGWEKRPSLIQEIEACKERLGEITVAAGKARRFWPLGNHDARFETRLATVAPEYARVEGVSLQAHFPDWEPCWSLFVNDDVVIKHRFKGGIHATHNNALWSGKTIVTGHLHSLKVTPLTDYNGSRFGVDTGCLAETFAPAFQDYLEDGPRNWRSGFAVLTFHRGDLLWPEVVHVRAAGEVEFRGKIYSV
jgi:hypothetical protein